MFDLSSTTKTTAAFALGLLASPLLAVAQLASFGWALALVGFVPLLIAIRSLSPTSAAMLGALVGTAYGCLVGAWIPEALGELRSSYTASVLGLLFTAAWAKAAIFLGIALSANLTKSSSPLLQVVVVGAACGLSEWLMGASKLGVPYFFVGHSQLPVRGVAQLALVGGVPLISGWLVAVNQSIALWIQGAWSIRRASIALVASWVVTGAFGLDVARMVRPDFVNGGEISFLIVQPDIPHDRRWIADLEADHLKRMIEATRDALVDQPLRPDVVLWPENMITAWLDREPALLTLLQGAVDELELPILTGSVRSGSMLETGVYRSSVLWFTPHHGIVAEMDKQIAIPLLESSSWFPGESFVRPLFGEAAYWPKVSEAESASSLTVDFTVTPVLCYEILFPGLVSNRRDRDSVALINLADDSWVSGEQATRALANMSRFRAIEQRLHLIRVAHGGLSTLIGPYGEVLSELPMNQWASTVVTISPSPHPTATEKFALLVLPVGVGLSVWWLAGTMRRLWLERTLPKETDR